MESFTDNLHLCSFKRRKKYLQEGTAVIRRNGCSRDKGCCPAANRALTYLLNSASNKNTAEAKRLLDTLFPTMGRPSATNNSGSIRKKEKARWEEHLTVSTKLVLMGASAIFFVQTDSNLLQECCILYLQLHCYQVHPLFTTGRKELYLQVRGVIK